MSLEIFPSEQENIPTIKGERSVNMSTMTVHEEDVINEKWSVRFGTTKSDTNEIENIKQMKRKVSISEDKVKELIYKESFDDEINQIERDNTENELDDSSLIEEEVEEEIEVEEEEEGEEEEDIEEGMEQEYDEGEEREIEERLSTTEDDENVPEHLEAPAEFDDETEKHEKELKSDQQDEQKEEDDEKGQLTDQEKDEIVSVPVDTEETLPADETGLESTRRKLKTKKKIIRIKKLVKRKKVSEEQVPVVEPEPSYSSGKRHIELKDDQHLKDVVTKKVLVQEEEEIDFEAKKKIAEHEKLLETVRSKLTELMKARKKNRMLHKSMIDYYKKKKMEYVYEGEVPTTETVRRYIKKVKVLDEMTNATELERQKRAEEISGLKSKLQEYDNDYKKELTAFLNWEREIGKSVIESHTGTGTDEDIVELLVQRQEVVLNQLSSARLRLIKLEKQLSLKEDALKNLVCLEGNLSLLDFEQLRMENHNFAEKIDERDEELSKLRRKMQSVIHAYAHVLEKANSITDDIDRGQMHTHYIDLKVNCVREQVSKMKQYRDGLRGETGKLKKSAGLVLQPKLVIDYEDSLVKLQEITTKLENSENVFNERKSKIVRLRELIQTITTLHSLT